MKIIQAWILYHATRYSNNLQTRQDFVIRICLAHYFYASALTQVRVDEDGLVHVKAKRKDLDLNKRTKDMSARDPENTKTVIIVGGGPSGATCAESLRQEGFTGRIVMVCKEDVVPYDRIKVSKVLDFDVHKSALRPPSFYDDNKIETKLGVEAIGTKKSRSMYI